MAYLAVVRSRQSPDSCGHTDDMESQDGNNISFATLRRSLREFGLHEKVARKKPFASTKNRKLWLQFAGTVLIKQIQTDSEWSSLMIVSFTGVGEVGFSMEGE